MQLSLMLFLLTFATVYEAYELIKAVEDSTMDKENIAVSSSQANGTLKANDTSLSSSQESKTASIRTLSEEDQALSPRLPNTRFFTFTAVDHNGREDYEEVGESQNEPKDYDVIFANAPVPKLEPALEAVASNTAKQQTVINILSPSSEAKDVHETLANSAVKPNKPEVVYIKYKKPEEAGILQEQIQNFYKVITGPAQNFGETVSPVLTADESLALFHPYRSYRDYGSYGAVPLSISPLGIPNYYIPSLF